MPAGPLRITLEDAAARRLLAELTRKARDLGPWYRFSVDPTITDFFKRQFKSAGAAGGQRWAPIRPLTEKLRSRRGHGLAGSKAILIDSDGLRRGYVNVGAGIGFRRITRAIYERGVQSTIAMLHQTGFRQVKIFGRVRKKPIKVPARKVVPDEMPTALIRKWETSLVRRFESRVS